VWFQPATYRRYRSLALFVVAWVSVVAFVAQLPEVEGRSPALPDGAPRALERLTLQSYASTVLADGPSLYYRMNEASGLVAHDSSGTGNDVTATQVYLAAGALANDADAAWTLGGAASGTANGVPVGSASRSVEGWIRVPSENFVSWGAGVGLFQVHVSGASVVVDYGGSSRSFTASHSLADGGNNGNWHHVAVTYDGTTLAAYADGEAIGTASVGSLATTASSMYVGRFGVAAAGSIDEVAVYQAALTPGQIAAHFAASGNGRPLLPGSLTLTPGANKLTVQWPAPTNGVPSGALKVTRFVVTASQTDGPGRVIDATGEDANVVFSGLPAGRSFTFHLASFNQFGVGDALDSVPALASGTGRTYASTVQDDGPSLYYRFSDPSGSVSADSSATGNDMTGGSDINRGLPTALLTDPDPAITTWSSQMSLISGTSAGLPVGSQDRSVEGWLRVEPADGGSLASWGAGSGRFQIDSSSSSALTLLCGGQSLTFTAPSVIQDNTWHHIVVTYAGSTNILSAYLDGRRLGQQQPSTALATTATTLRVGYQGPAVDELAIYPSVLSPAQVATHYYVSLGRSEGALS
jgi:hypothetical protein